MLATQAEAVPPYAVTASTEVDVAFLLDAPDHAEADRVDRAVAEWSTVHATTGFRAQG